MEDTFLAESRSYKALLMLVVLWSIKQEATVIMSMDSGNKQHFHLLAA